MMKLHQLYSGTVKFESGTRVLLSHVVILNLWPAIFYKFKEELNVAAGDTYLVEEESLGGQQEYCLCTVSVGGHKEAKHYSLHNIFYVSWVLLQKEVDEFISPLQN